VARRVLRNLSQLRFYLKTFSDITKEDISKLSGGRGKTNLSSHLPNPPSRPETQAVPDISARMSELNEAWSQIQIKHFKNKGASTTVMKPELTFAWSGNYWFCPSLYIVWNMYRRFSI